MKKQYPLSDTQLGIVAELIKYPETLHYNLPAYVRLSSSTDVVRLKEKIEEFLVTHDFWKINISHDGNDFHQVLDYDKKPDVCIVEIGDRNIEEYVNSIIEPFDIFNGCLVRSRIIVAGNDKFYFMDFSHLVSDGVSYSITGKQMGQLYEGEEIPQEEESIFEHILNVAEFRKTSGYADITKHYKALLQGKQINAIAPEPVNPLDRSLSTMRLFDRLAVDSWCKQTGLRVAALFNAAYCLLLSSLTRSTDVGYATIFHGRDRKTRNSFGTFITTVPFITSLNPDATVRDFVARMGNDLMGIMRYRNYSYLNFVQETAVYFDTVFAYQGPQVQATLDIEGECHFGKQMRALGKTTAPLSLVIYDTEDGMDYAATAECSAARCSEAFINDFVQAYVTIIHNMLSCPDSPIKEIELLSETERETLLKAGTQAPAAPDSYTNVVQAIDAVASGIPDAVAVVSDNETLSYAELVAKSCEIAGNLQSQGLKKGSFVCIEAYRSASTIATMLGVLRAGMAYVPIDPDYPQERKDFMRSDSQSQSTVYEDSAYMIYTSGSTGTPKGVVISNRALWAFVRGIREVLGISCRDRISCHSNFSFDASVEDIYPVLTCGGTLYIVPEYLRKDPPSLIEWLKYNCITGGNYTTRLGQLLLGSYDLPSLRYIVLGGEKMTVWPERNRHIATFNTYGPTEFTVDASWHLLDSDREYDDIPLGRPMPGQTIAVFDGFGHILPRSFTGEICLRGDQMASGYHGRNSFPTFGDFYRTGDIGRWNERMELEYMSRSDNQCKLNGFRVELSEIDSSIMKMEDISDVKTVLNSKANCLVSYYVAAKAVPETEIRDFLRNSLPLYMIPRHFIRMEELPLTTVGKLNIKALPEPANDSRGEGVQAQNDKERQLFDIISSVLGYDDFGVTDELALLGISSIQMMQALVMSNNKGIDVNLTDFYVPGATVRSLAEARKTDNRLMWYNSPEDKPVMMFFCGITPVLQLKPLLDKLGESYRILLCPPLSPDTALETPQILDNYASEAGNLLGSEQVGCIAGHSFGGELAYRMACRLGNRPVVQMFDTTKRIPSLKGVSLERLPSNLKLYIRLHDSEALQGYKGKIVLVSAQRRDEAYKILLPKLAEELSAQKNEQEWQASNPEIDILRVDATHDNISL